MKLHPFQLEVNRNAWRDFSQGAKAVLLQAPTGSGKTVMGSHLIAMRQTHAKEQTIVFAHRREIVKQTADKLELAGLIPEIIMAGHAPNPWANVKVASLHTVWARHKRGVPFPQAGFLVIDECHLCGASRYRDLVKHYLASGAKLLGLTATPMRNDGFGLGNMFQSMVRAPDVPWLVANGFLCRPEYVIGRAPSAGGLTGGNDYSAAQVDKLFDDKVLIGDILDNWFEFASDRPTMIFTAGVASSMRLVERFKERGITAQHIDGDTEDSVRDGVYEASKSGALQVISNAQVYIEGADFPWISCVVYAHITKSLIRYLQEGGRGLRTCIGKKDLLVLDHGGNWDRHGPLDINREWELVEGDAREKLEQQRKTSQKLTVSCPKCGLVHSAKICPRCNAAPRELKDSEFIEAMLKRVTVADWEARQDHKIKVKAEREEKQEFYSGFLGIAMERGHTSGWAAHRYKEKFGVWPRNLDQTPATPSREVLSFDQHCRIKWAKGGFNDRQRSN